MQMKDVVSTLTISTSWGPITVQACDGSIVACDLAHADPDTNRKPLTLKTSRIAKHSNTKNNVVLKSADAFVRGLFNGEYKAVPKLLIPDGTDFQRNVWKQLHKMKPGQTQSYGDVAKKAGRPKAFRAAGQACGANKIPLFIPCHRVVASSGGLGGFSCGLAWKEKLLDIESRSSRRNKVSRRRSS